jgi:hypothetical protein
MKALILLILLAISLSAQELTPLEIAKKTIEASGGENWRRPKTLQLSGKATIYWFGTPKVFNNYKMWRVFPDENKSAHSANGKVRFDAFEDGQKLFFQIAFDGKNTFQNLSPEAKQQEEQLKWGNNFGFSIFRFVESEGFSLVRLTDDKVDGHQCYFIKIIDAKKTETIFGIDKRTFFIRAAFFKTPIGFHQRFYDDFKWHKNPKFIQPRSLRIFNDGVKTTEIFWSCYKVNQPIDDKIFEIK